MLEEIGSGKLGELRKSKGNCVTVEGYIKEGREQTVGN